MMPEARGWMMPGGGGVEEVITGFWIRRAAPSSAAARHRQRDTFSDNKENMPPLGSGRRKRSPLPEWYPRTPLRDITAIVNALERRRLRVRAAAVRQSVSNQTLSSQGTLSDISDPSSNPTAAATSSTSSEHSLQAASSILTPFSPTENSTETSLLSTDSAPDAAKPIEPGKKLLSSIDEMERIVSPTENSTETSLLSTDSAPDAAKPIEPGKKLLSSIDEIERIVLENTKRTLKGPAEKATRTSTLLSMR